MSTIICPVCASEGRQSTVRNLGGFVTLLSHEPFYDESGQLHSHDPNRMLAGYSCSNGHRFKRTYYIPCEVCGWKAGEDGPVEVLDPAAP